MNDRKRSGKPAEQNDRRSSGPAKKYAGKKDAPTFVKKRFDGAERFKEKYGSSSDAGKEERSYDKGAEGDSKPFRKSADKKFGDKPAWKKDRPAADGDRKPRFEKKEFSDRKDKPRKDFGDKPAWKKDRPAGDDDRKPRFEKKESSDRKDRPRKDFGDKPAWKKDRPAGDDDRKPRFEKKEFSDRKDRPRKDFGDKPAWKKDRPAGDGDRKPRFEKKEYSDRKDRPAKDFDDKPARKHNKDFDPKDFKPRAKKDDDVKGARSDKPTFKKELKADRPYREKGDFDKKEFKPKRGWDDRDFDDEDFAGEAKETWPMPLNKYIAHCGECGRREAAELVKQGKVRVNGELVLAPAHRVSIDDKITLAGKKLTLQKHLAYILLNKPKGFITTTDDPKDRKTVMDLVASSDVERLFPVGRLDRNTTGVLIMTNDGALAQKLSHPKYEVKKIYQVTLDKPLTKADFEKIVAGVELEDGKAMVDSLAYLEIKNELGIEIHSGKNRIVRRIFESLGYVVEKLDRVMYAGLTKKNVQRGKWRFLSDKEIVFLKHFKN